MRSRLLYAATAALLLNVVVPAGAQSGELDRATVHRLVKQVWAAGTWEQQEAAFAELTYEEQVAAWAVMTDVRPGPVRLASDDAELGPCREQEIDQCDHAVAPQPQPTAKPAPKDPAKPPVVTPPVTRCTAETAYQAYKVIIDDQEIEMFVYAATLAWCYQHPSVSGPLTSYSSYSFSKNCCVFPWNTDANRYIDKLTPLPAANTQKIIDHHTGYFFAKAKFGTFEAGQTNTPNIDATVLPDGSYVCGG